MLRDSIAFTQFAQDIDDAMAANITAFRFFSLPDTKATEAVVFHDIISSAHNMDDQSMITVGKARGTASGFTWITKPEMAEVGCTVCLAEVFGFDDVADHQRWRDTPEHVELKKAFESRTSALGLRAVDVLGKRRSMFDGSGVLHAALQKI